MYQSATATNSHIISVTCRNKHLFLTLLRFGWCSLGFTGLTPSCGLNTDLQLMSFIFFGPMVIQDRGFSWLKTGVQKMSPIVHPYFKSLLPWCSIISHWKKTSHMAKLNVLSIWKKIFLLFAYDMIIYLENKEHTDKI